MSQDPQFGKKVSWRSMYMYICGISMRWPTIKNNEDCKGYGQKLKNGSTRKIKDLQEKLKNGSTRKWIILVTKGH